MVSNLTFVPEEIAQKIKDTASLGDVIQDFVPLKKQGSSQVGECPYCHAKKFTYTPSKDLYKCFSGCQKGGNNAVQFLIDMKGMTYVEALVYLADRYSILIEDPRAKQNGRSRGNRQISFRDEQLRESGISDQYQKYFLHENEHTQIEADRYQAGSIDKAWNVIPGDDMILHYIDLDGKPMSYLDRRGKRKPLIRVRWANPALHKAKDGKPIKYQSPAGSGSHLWIPNRMLEWYKKHQIIETLYVTEGEKKADKLCLHDIPAVGVMGIHNLTSAGEMPYHFEMLIKRCGVANVVFLLDSDWQELSLTKDKPIDQRPRNFFQAVLKFRDYFYAYNNTGIQLRIYFAAGTSKVHKGVDDLLHYELRGREQELAEELNQVRTGHQAEGSHVVMHDITEIGTYKLKEFWHLHSTPAFLEHHKETLKKIRQFQLGRIQWRYNEEEDKFELAQKILPHEQFWQELRWEDKSGNDRCKYEFRYDPCLTFLFNRGFGLYQHQKHQYRFVQVNNRVVEETTPLEIRRYMIEFSRQIDEPEVTELLLRGGKQYFGPDNMSNLRERYLRFNEASQECMYMYFKNCFWKITAGEITQQPISELPANVWQNKIIDFEPSYLGPIVNVDRVGDQWKIDLKKDLFDKCDMARFYQRTSMFSWRKLEREVENEQGQKVIVKKEHPDPMTQEEIDLFKANFVAKMLAAGYILHDYRDYSQMKAVVCMDGMESEVGKSQGGTGKSIWGKQFEHIFPISVIDGKKKNIEDDNFLYEDVDERTGAIIYDDVRVNFNFEMLFSQITTGLQVNKKGEKKFSIEPPKFIVITNHALNGEGNSFRRRQYTISFSDYYNGTRTVADDFGHNLFYDWDNEQWNLFYNWMANCLQTYLRFGLNYNIPNDVLIKRKLRQKIGENFLAWATLMFDTELDKDGKPMGIMLNKKIEKSYITWKYIEQDPNARKYVNPRKMKDKLRMYCDYAGLQWNPTADGQRIKSNGKEYFILADKTFNAQEHDYPIDNDDDLSRSRSSFF